MSSDARLVSIGAMGLDEFSCPNCSMIIDPDRVRVTTIGCIVRHTLKAERAYRRDLQRLAASFQQQQGSKGLTTASTGGNAAAAGRAHVATSEDIRELFTTSSVYVTSLPPIIASMKCTLSELTQRTKLLEKDVHLCVDCYEQFVDAKEIHLQATREATNLMKKQAAEAMPKSLQALQERNQQEAFEFNTRNPNRLTDMVFTGTQARQRSYIRDMELKRGGKEGILTIHNADVDALGVDWSVISPTAAREMRRVAGTVAASGRLSPLSGGGNSTDAPPLLVTSTDHQTLRITGGPSSPPNSAGRAITRGGSPVDGTTAPEHPLLVQLESESQPTAFDVSFDDRLMADLYATMCSVCDFSGAEGAVPLPPTHPLYMVYRNGANALPKPPVTNLMLSPPHPLDKRALTEPQIIRAIPSELKGIEETPILDSERRLIVGKALKTMGLGELTGEELHLLDTILQDATIEAPSEDEMSDGYGSDYDSEGGSEDEFIRGY